MVDDTERKEGVAESVPVVLARMEGKLDGIKDKVGDLVGRMNKVEDRLTTQEKLTLRLSLDAQAEEAKKIALALALKDADENRRMQSEQTWTPTTRFFSVLAALVSVVGLVIYFFSLKG